MFQKNQGCLRLISYLVVSDSKAVPESPVLFKHLTCATKSKIWGRSELPTEHLLCDSQGLPALCSCRELLSPLILAEEQHQVCQEPLPPFSSGRHRWNTPLKHIGEGGGRDADFTLGCGQGVHLVGGITNLQTLQEGSGCHPKPSCPAEPGGEALRAASIRAECKNPHSTQEATKPTGYTQPCWLLCRFC